MNRLPLSYLSERALKFNKKIIEEIESSLKGRKFKLQCFGCSSIYIQQYRDVFTTKCANCSETKKKVRGEVRARKKAKECNLDFLGFVGYRSEHYYWLVKCNACGKTKESQIYDFGKCEQCAIIKLTSNTEEFIAKSFPIHGDKYDYHATVYERSGKKVKIKCRKCNCYFFQTPDVHLSGSGCPKCKQSKGELRIEKYLIEKGIEFNWHVSFDDLKYKSKLVLDFFVEAFGTILEYDGEGHYLESFYHGRSKDPAKSLSLTQIRDRVKDEWARSKGYKILRIPYWDFDRIEEILDAFFAELIGKRNIQLTLDL